MKFKGILMLFLLLSLLLAPMLQAQEGIKVLSQEHEEVFAESIAFRLYAESDSEITEITLSYKLTSEVAVNRATPDFKPGRKVDAEWVWELEPGEIPLGSEISYYWTVRDQAGNRLRTEPIYFTYSDTRFDWRSISEGKITLYWYDRNEEFARHLLDAATEALARLEEEIGVELAQQVKIFVYNSKGDMRLALHTRSRTFDEFVITLGTVVSEDTMILLGAASDVEKTIAHELSHVVVGLATKNPLGEIPRWLDEGLAMYAEGELPFFNLLSLEEALFNNTLISARSLSGYTGLAEQVDLYYGEVYTVIEFLLEKYGKEKMSELLAVFKKGAHQEDALQEVYGFSLDELDAQWRAWLYETYGAGLNITPQPPPTPEKKIIVPKRKELYLRADPPITLDPALASDADSTEFILKIFSGLVALDADLNIVPDIAESWEVSEDGTVYTFHLRKDVYFHDGKHVTAHDFKYSMERACDPATGSMVASSYLGDIVGALDKLAGRAKEVRGIESLDDYTLRITIDAPKAYFLSKLAYHTCFVVDKENVESGPDWTEHPNGTGPFKWGGEEDYKIVLFANERFYDGKPFFEKVNFYTDGGVPVTMYEQGELDAVRVGTQDIERVLDPTNPLHEELVIIPSLDVQYIVFNVNVPPFDDVLVRQAFAHATNKEGLVNVLLQRMRVAARGILPPGMPGYNPHLAGLPYDPELAAKLLKESSYAGDLPPITFSVAGYTGLTNPVAEALVNMYAEALGVEIEIQQMSFGELLERLDRRDFQMAMLGWIADFPDPYDFLDILFHGESDYNYMGYSNAEVNALLEKARLEKYHEERMRLYREAEEILVEEAPWIPLYHSVDYVLIKPYLQKFSVTMQGTYYLQDAYFGAE